MSCVRRSCQTGKRFKTGRNVEADEGKMKSRSGSDGSIQFCGSLSSHSVTVWALRLAV